MYPKTISLETLDFAEIYANLTKRWLSPVELETQYGFSLSSQAKMRMITNKSLIPFSKVGKYIRYDRVAIDKWLEEHKVQGE